MRRICGPDILLISAARGSVRALPAAMSVLSILLAGCYFYSRKKGNGSGDLEKNLMDTDSDRTLSVNNWVVPVNNSGLPSEHGETCKPVWLVPMKSQDPAVTVSYHQDQKDKKEMEMPCVDNNTDDTSYSTISSSALYGEEDVNEPSRDDDTQSEEEGVDGEDNKIDECSSHSSLTESAVSDDDDILSVGTWEGDM
jgi:hypothetical protein